MDNGTEKPVYFKNSELLPDNQNLVNYDILQSILMSVGDNVKCIQLDRDLWRIYLTNKECRQKLLDDGFQLKNQSVSVYDSNPFSFGATHQSDPVLKVTIAGLPLSVKDKEVLKMLQGLNVELKSVIRYENIKNPVTGKLTSVLNGNRFVFVAPLPDGTSLPRNAYCADLKCRIYHSGQK